MTDKQYHNTTLYLISLFLELGRAYMGHLIVTGYAKKDLANEMKITMSRINNYQKHITDKMPPEHRTLWAQDFKEETVQSFGQVLFAMARMTDEQRERVEDFAASVLNESIVNDKNDAA